MLLENLSLEVSWRAPMVTEEALSGEVPSALAERLGISKARAVASAIDISEPWVVLGSDQVCHQDGHVYGKPGNFDNARQQLRDFSGKWVTFTSSIALIDSNHNELVESEDFQVRFRDLSDQDIATYLTLDQPYDCAGSIKAEKLGIVLIADTRGRDINVLYGLPIMLFSELLPRLGLDIFKLKRSP